MARKFGNLSAEDAIKKTPYRSGTAVEGGFRSALANLRAGALSHQITLAQQAAYERYGASAYVDNPLDDIDTSGQPVEVGPEAYTNAYIQTLEAQRQREQAFAAGVAPRVQRVEGIKSLGDAANYVGGVVGAAPVTMAPVIGAAVAGRVGGKVLAPMVRGASPAVAKALPAVGGGAAAYATSYNMLADENLNAQLNDPIAAAQPAAVRRRNARLAAAGGAVLDAALPVGLAAGVRKLGMSGGNAAMGALGGVGVEGVTEASQLGLQNMQLRDLGGTTMQDSALDYLNAGVAGAIGGGAMSGATAGAGYIANKFAKPEAPVDQALAQEIDAARQSAAARDPAMSDVDLRDERERAQPGYAGSDSVVDMTGLTPEQQQQYMQDVMESDSIADVDGELEIAEQLRRDAEAAGDANQASMAQQRIDHLNRQKRADVEWKAKWEAAQPGYAGDVKNPELGMAPPTVVTDTDVDNFAARADAAYQRASDIRRREYEELAGVAASDTAEKSDTVGVDDPVLRALNDAQETADVEGRYDDVVDIQERIDAHLAQSTKDEGRAARDEEFNNLFDAIDTMGSDRAAAKAEQDLAQEQSTVEEIAPDLPAQEAIDVLEGNSQVDEEALAADPVSYEQTMRGEKESATHTLISELSSGKYSMTPAQRKQVKDLAARDQFDDGATAEVIALYNQVANPSKLSDAVQRLKEGGTVADSQVKGDEKHSFADAKLSRNTAPLRREIEVELISSGLVTDPNQAREVAKNIMLLDTLSAQSDKEINAVQYAAMIEGREVIKKFDQSGKIAKTLAAARELEAQRLAEGKEPHASSIVSATRDTLSSQNPDLFNRYPALSDLDSSIDNGRWEESVMVRIMPADARSRVLGINDAAPNNVKRDGVARPIFHIATWIDTANDPSASEFHREDARKRLLSFYKDKARVDLVLNAYKDLRSAATKTDPRQIDEERSILAEEMAGNETIAPLNNEDYKLAEERELDGAWLDNDRLDAQKDLRPVEYAGSGKYGAPFSSKAATRETAGDREWVGLADHLERNDPNVDPKIALRDAVRSVRSEMTEVLGASIKDKWNSAAVKQIRNELGLPTNAKHQDDDNLARVTEAMRVKYAAAREDLARVEEARAEMEFTKVDPEATESERLIAQEEYQTLRREAVQTHGREFLVNAHQGRVVWGPGKYSDTLGPQIEEMSSYPAWVYREEDMASLEEAPADMVRSALNELKVNVAKGEDGGINLSRQEVIKIAESKGNIRLEEVDAKRGHRMVTFKDERTGKDVVLDVRRLADMMLSKLSKNGALSPKAQSWSQHRAEALLQALGSLQMIPGFENIFKGETGKQLHDRIAGLVLSEKNPKYFPEAKSVTVGSLVKTKGGNFQRKSEADIRADVNMEIESGVIKDPEGLGHDILLEAEVQKRLGQQRLIARSHTEAVAWAQREVDDAVKKGKFKHLEGKDQEAAIKAEVDKLTKLFNQQSVKASRMGDEEGAGIIRVPSEGSVAGKVDRQAIQAQAEKMGVVDRDTVIEPDAPDQPEQAEGDPRFDGDRKEQHEIESGKKPNRDLTGAPITYTDKKLPFYRAVVDPTARFEYRPTVEEAIAKVVEDVETPPVRGRATLAEGRDVNGLQDSNQDVIETDVNVLKESPQVYSDQLSQEDLALIDSILDEVEFEKSHTNSARQVVQIGHDYKYSGHTYTGKPITANVQRLLGRIKQLTGITYNGVLINHYPANTRSGIGMHTDAEPELNMTVPVLSISLGDSAKFNIVVDGKTQTLTLNTGDIAVFNGNSKHGITPTQHSQGRISLTFRQFKEGDVTETTEAVRGRATLARGRDVKAEILEGGITEMGVLTNHSGGAKGADTAWDTIGREFGVVNHNHYREPSNFRQNGSQAGQVDSKVLTDAGVASVDIKLELYAEGVDKATIASRQLGRIGGTHTARSPYTIRNWAQVKNADAVFAVGQIIPAGTEMRHGKKALREQVSGGTGVAVRMAINAQKPVYVFDQVQGGWFAWDGKTFVPTKTPVLTKNFAGIGTRELTPAGRAGIRAAYALTQRAIEKAHAQSEAKSEKKTTARKPAINARQKAFIDQTNAGALTGQVIEDPVALVENLVDVFTELAQNGHLDGSRTSAAKKAAHVWVEVLDPKSVFHIGRRALAAGVITTTQYEAILEKTGHAVDKHEGHTFVGKSTPGFADDFKKAMKMMSKDKTMSEQELYTQTGWFRDARGEWRKDINTVGEYTALGANLMQMEMKGETTRKLGAMLNGQGAGRALRTHMDKVTVSMPSAWSLDTPNTFDEAAGVIHVNPVRQILHAARRDQMFKLGDKVISYRELKLLFGKENAKGELVLASKAEVAGRFAAKFPDTAGALETALNDAAAASALEGVQRIVQQLSYAESQVNSWTGAAIDYLDGDKEAQKLVATIADPSATLEERGAARLALLEQVAQTVGATIYNEDGSVNTEKRDFVADIIAQQMAKDPREREIRNMLDSRFGTTYPRGSKLADMEAALTDEQRAVRDQMTAEITRMIGTRISQQFDILEGDSEHGRGAFVEYRALDGSSVLKVLRFAAATQSGDVHVARHESVHAFFSMLKGLAKQQVWRDLRRAIVESSRVRSEVVNAYKDQQAVLDQLDPRKNPDYEEELIAYAFQLYVDGKLNLNPKSRNFFNKVVAFVSNVLGLATQEQRAAALFDALLAGELNPSDPEKGGYGGRNIANKMRELSKRGKPTETFRNKLERTAPGVARMADTLFATPTEVLRNSGSKALTELAEMFAPHMASARNGGLIANRGQRAAQFHNRWSKLVGKFEKSELSQALADAQAMREPTTAAGREVRKFLSDMYQYSNEAGVKRWDPKLREYKDIVEMQNYFPRVWEHGYISQHEDEFKTLIKKHSKMSDDEIDALLREIAENDGRIEILTEKAGLDAGFTPFQASISKRGFTFINESNAHEFAKFQSQDMNDIMAGYIEQAVHRAEYTRLFGNRGEVIDKLIQRAAVEDGISPEEIIRTYRYHIDALSGTLGSHSMGRGLRLAQATAITAQNIILLPFAIFSQVIDGLGSSVRTGSIRSAKDAYGQVLKDMTRFAFRDKSYDYAQDVAEMLGVVSQEAAVHAVNNAGMFMMNKGLRNVNRHFFKWNGMSGWNDSMRKAAMITGIQFLEQHTGLKGGKVDERRFEELGLTLEEAKDMVVRFREGEKRGVAPEFSTPQAQAMYRFVDQAVIRPNASMRASWLSDPRWMIFAHLKQFTYGMHKVTIARALHEADNDNAASLAILAGYAPMALAADMTKWALLGMNVTENWGTWDYMKHAVSRGGLLGLWEFGTNVAGDAGSGRIPGSSLVGPTVEHGMTVARSLNVGVDKPVDWDRIVDRSVPGYKYVSSD